MKLVNALTVFAFTLFMSMMVSAQAQAFDVGGLSYTLPTRREYCRRNGSRVWKYWYGHRHSCQCYG